MLDQRRKFETIFEILTFQRPSAFGCVIYVYITVFMWLTAWCHPWQLRNHPRRDQLHVCRDSSALWVGLMLDNILAAPATSVYPCSILKLDPNLPLLQLDDIRDPCVSEDVFRELFMKCRSCRKYVIRGSTVFHECQKPGANSWKSLVWLHASILGECCGAGKIQSSIFMLMELLRQFLIPVYFLLSDSCNVHMRRPHWWGGPCLHVRSSYDLKYLGLLRVTSESAKSFLARSTHLDE